MHLFAIVCLQLTVIRGRIILQFCAKSDKRTDHINRISDHNYTLELEKFEMGAGLVRKGRFSVTANFPNGKKKRKNFRTTVCVRLGRKYVYVSTGNTENGQFFGVMQFRVLGTLKR